MNVDVYADKYKLALKKERGQNVKQLHLSSNLASLTRTRSDQNKTERLLVLVSISMQ